MIREVRWTDWSEDHVAAHGVRPDEVEDVLFDPPRWTAGGRNGTTLVYGNTAAGRRLLAVVLEEGDEVVFVISAREMTDSERRTFSKKAR